MSRRGAIVLDPADAVAGGCAIGIVALVGAAGIGWVLNIVKIFAGLADPITGMWVMRIVGVPFFFIGCIVGWL